MRWAFAVPNGPPNQTRKKSSSQKCEQERRSRRLQIRVRNKIYSPSGEGPCDVWSLPDFFKKFQWCSCSVLRDFEFYSPCHCPQLLKCFKPIYVILSSILLSISTLHEANPRLLQIILDHHPMPCLRAALLESLSLSVLTTATIATYALWNLPVLDRIPSAPFLF